MIRCDCAQWSQGPNGSRFLFRLVQQQNNFSAVSKNKAQFNLATVIFLATEIEKEEKKRTYSLSKVTVVINANIGQIGPTKVLPPIRLFSALAINCAYLSCSSFCLIFAQSLSLFLPVLPAVYCLPFSLYLFSLANHNHLQCVVWSLLSG